MIEYLPTEAPFLVSGYENEPQHFYGIFNRSNGKWLSRNGRSVALFSDTRHAHATITIDNLVDALVCGLDDEGKVVSSHSYAPVQGKSWSRPQLDWGD